MTNTTVSPFVVSDLQQVELADANGNKKTYWRKEILPHGTRMYKGKVLDFSKINPACVKAFEDNAVDQVPFVLALADNKHPETGQELNQLEGDLTKLEMSKEGSLFGYFDLSDDVVKTINKSNKKLGVSARIDLDYRREDTQQVYPYALRHVCATTAAHIKGMKPWESVELSEEDKAGDILDFSTEVIEEVPTKKETGDDLVAVDIPKAQLDRLLAFIGDIDKADEIANKLQSDDKSNTPAPAQLSEETTKRIELAETSAKNALELAERAQNEAAATKWESLKKELARDGVPPVMLTEAEPLMKLYKRPSIQLSESETLDAGTIIGNILEHAKGTIKFSEEGHSVTDAGSTEGNKEYDEFEKDFLSNFRV